MAAAGACGGTRASEAARPDFHRLFRVRIRRLQVALSREGLSVGPPVHPAAVERAGAVGVRPKRITSKRHPKHKVLSIPCPRQDDRPIEPGVGS
jgi:hypothetical protein